MDVLVGLNISMVGLLVTGVECLSVECRYL